jgi:hypothetical protein
MAMTPLPTKRDRWHAWLAFVFRTRAAALSVDLALVAARIALAWIFHLLRSWEAPVTEEDF